MPTKRPSTIVSRCLGAAAVLTVAAFVVMRSGEGTPPPGSSSSSSAPPPPAVAPKPAPAPAPAPPATATASASVAEEPTPGTHAPDPYRSREPGMTEQEALVHWACLGELQRLRPIPGGSDAEQRHAIEVRKGFDAFARRMAALDAQIKGKAPPPEPVSDVRCPEQRLRQMYEEDRQRDLQRR